MRARPLKDWPHAPIHRLDDTCAVYMVTGATLRKSLLFKGVQRLSLLENEMLSLARKHQWHLQAWAIFANHYHLVARGGPNSSDLDAFLHELHSNTARKLNEGDDSIGRQVWYNFWETKLTYERSYLARLNYVHQNPVRHGLANVANQYQWCSARWFEKTATPAAIRTIYSFKTDKLNIADDY